MRIRDTWSVVTKAGDLWTGRGQGEQVSLLTDSGIGSSTLLMTSFAVRTPNVSLVYLMTMCGASCSECKE